MAASETAAGDAIAERILDAALAEIGEYGLRRVTVDDIARRAGIHRVTVYTRFGTKDEILTAAAIAWTHRFFGAIAAKVDGLPVDERLVEGFVLSAQTMRTDPLITRLLTAEPDVMLPLLTVDSGPVIDAVRTFFAEQLRDPSVPDPESAAELAARISLSLFLNPRGHFPIDTPDQLRMFARRHLVPLLERQ
jgi:AcrR family transcriptional regulator